MPGNQDPCAFFAGVAQPGTAQLLEGSFWQRKIANPVSARISRFKSGRRRIFIHMNLTSSAVLSASILCR